MAETYDTQIVNSGIASAVFTFTASSSKVLAARDLSTTNTIQEAPVSTRDAELPGVYSTQIINSGVYSLAFTFTAREQGTKLLIATSLAPDNLIKAQGVDTGVYLSTTGLTDEGEPLIQGQAVGTTHAVATTPLEPDNKVEPGGLLITQELSAAFLSLKTTNTITGGPVDTEVALHAGGQEPLNRIESGVVALVHALVTQSLEPEFPYIKEATVLSDSALSTTALSPVNAIEAEEVYVEVAIAARDMGYSGGVVPIIQSGRLIQEGEITGDWAALPVATVAFSDVYDENDALAGTDAHDSVADQSDNRWLRPNYQPGTTTAAFTFASGLPGNVDVTSIDTASVRVHGRLMEETTPHDNDPLSFACQVVGSDDVTPLTERVEVFTDLTALTTFEIYNVGLPINITDRDAWVGARIYFQWTHTKVGALDDVALAVSQLYLGGTYTAGYLDNNLSQTNLIPFSRVGVTQILECGALLQPDLDQVIKGDTVLHTRVMETGSLEQIPDVDNPIEAGAVAPSHKLSISSTTYKVHNEIEARRVWHDLYLTGRLGLASYSKIEDGHVIESQDLSALSLWQSYAPIRKVITEQTHLLSTPSLDQYTGIEEVEIAQDSSLYPAIGPPINYIERGRLVHYHTCVAKPMIPICLIKDGWVVVEGLINAGRLSSVGEVKGSDVRVTHVLSALEPPEPIKQEDNPSIEEAFMSVHHAPSTTGLVSDGDISRAVMPLPHALATPGLVSSGAVPEVDMPLPHALVVDRDLRTYNNIQGTQVSQTPFYPQDLGADNFVQGGRVDITSVLECGPPSGPVEQEEHPFIESGTVDVSHSLLARDAANDPECEAPRFYADHELGALPLVATHAIYSVNITHINGILGTRDLDGEHVIQSTTHELSPYRYAVAMVIGV